MTEEQKHQVSRGIGVVFNLAIDLALAYSIGKHFHSFAIGAVIYFVMARLDGLTDTLNELKRKI